MNGFGMCGGQSSERSPVKRPMERHQRQIGRSWWLVHHTTLRLELCEVHVFASLFAPVRQKQGFVGVFVGAGAAHHGGYVGEVGGHGEEDVAEFAGPVVAGEDAQRGSVD